MKQEMNDSITVWVHGKCLYTVHWNNTIILFVVKVGILPLSHAVIPSFISCFTARIPTSVSNNFLKCTSLFSFCSYIATHMTNLLERLLY